MPILQAAAVTNFEFAEIHVQIVNFACIIVVGFCPHSIQSGIHKLLNGSLLIFLTQQGECEGKSCG